MGPSRRSFLAAVGLGALAGCAGRPDASGSDPSDPPATVPFPMPDRGPFGFTHVRPDGNRALDGTGSLPAEPVTRSLDLTPAWIAGVADGDAVDWAVVGADGTTAGVRSGDGALHEVAVRPPSLPGGVPPVVANVDGPRLYGPPSSGASGLTHPFPLGDGRALVVGADGDVRLWDDGIVDRLSVGAPPDARIVEAGPGTYAVLGDATDGYDHGALGDDVEAGSLVTVEVGDGLTERSRARFGGAIAEGLLPLAATFGAADTLLVVTLTDASNGARVVAYGLDGDRVASGPAIGTGFRWRHQLCAAPFGPDGATELAVVKTPHIGGVAEFYRLRGDRLAVVAERSGYSSHAFGSRNLDGGLAADLDGDGATELLVPVQSRDELAAVRRTEDGTTEPWRLSLAGVLSTNLAGVTTASGRATIAAGTDDGRLYVWH